MGDALGILAQQRKRLVATLMNYCEKSDWWCTLTVTEQEAFRDKFISSLGSFYDVAIDAVKVTNGTG